MMRLAGLGPRELLLVVALMLGVGLVIGGLWLIWDWHHSFGRFMDWNAIRERWFFDAPFLIYRWTWPDVTVPFDVGAAMAVLGLLASIVSSYLIGRWRE